MNILKDLAAKNPGLPLYDVHDAAFAPYGRVLSLGDTSALHEAMLASPIPESGNCYVASDGALMALNETERIKNSVFGGMPVQAGYCNGHGFTLNAEEYHRCSEVNYTTTGLVLLLALPEDVVSCTLDSRLVAGFYLLPDTLVEIYPRVLHFAPCRISSCGFNCLVVLTEGTNSPLDAVDTSLPGEDGMLWMRNKWLLCHADSPQAEKGAFVGIEGENIALNI